VIWQFITICPAVRTDPGQEQFAMWFSLTANMTMLSGTHLDVILWQGSAPQIRQAWVVKATKIFVPPSFYRLVIRRNDCFVAATQNVNCVGRAVAPLFSGDDCRLASSACIQLYVCSIHASRQKCAQQLSYEPCWSDHIIGFPQYSYRILQPESRDNELIHNSKLRRG
jgi:hypothetical protein